MALFDLLLFFLGEVAGLIRFPSLRATDEDKTGAPDGCWYVCAVAAVLIEFTDFRLLFDFDCESFLK